MILYEIATGGFINYPDLSKRLNGISSGPLREKILILLGAGLIKKQGNDSMYNVSSKGKVFLDLVKKLNEQFTTTNINAELEYILKKLDCAPIQTQLEVDANIEIFPKNKFVSLIKTIKHAEQSWGLDFSTMSFIEEPHNLTSVPA